MTEQKKYEIPAPPKATNYKIKLEVTESGDTCWTEPATTGTLTCTLCNEVIHDHLDNWAIDGERKDFYIQERLTRHNRNKHRDLIYVLTSEGWMRAGDLIPDPVKQINDAIDASARHQGSPPSFLNK